jgi:hypothetical protein
MRWKEVREFGEDDRLLSNRIWIFGKGWNLQADGLRNNSELHVQVCEIIFLQHKLRNV